MGQHHLLSPALEAGAQFFAKQPCQRAFARTAVRRPGGQRGVQRRCVHHGFAQRAQPAVAVLRVGHGHTERLGRRVRDLGQHQRGQGLLLGCWLRVRLVHAPHQLAQQGRDHQHARTAPVRRHHRRIDVEGVQLRGFEHGDRVPRPRRNPDRARRWNDGGGLVARPLTAFARRRRHRHLQQAAGAAGELAPGVVVRLELGVVPHGACAAAHRPRRRGFEGVGVADRDGLARAAGFHGWGRAVWLEFDRSCLCIAKQPRLPTLPLAA